MEKNDHQQNSSCKLSFKIDFNSDLKIIEQIDCQLIKYALKTCNHNQTAAARLLKISDRGLRGKVKKYAIYVKKKKSKKPKGYYAMLKRFPN